MRDYTLLIMLFLIIQGCGPIDPEIDYAYISAKKEYWNTLEKQAEEISQYNESMERISNLDAIDAMNAAYEPIQKKYGKLILMHDSFIRTQDKFGRVSTFMEYLNEYHGFSRMDERYLSFLKENRGVLEKAGIDVDRKRSNHYQAESDLQKRLDGMRSQLGETTLSPKEKEILFQFLSSIGPIVISRR